MLNSEGPHGARPVPVTLAMGLAQMPARGRDIVENTRRIVSVLESHRGTDIIAFPELFLTGYETGDLDQLALTLEAEPIQRIAAACSRTGTAAVFGFVEAGPGGVYNSVAAIDEQGDVVGVYRKVNLFGAEAGAFLRGETHMIMRLAGVDVGILNCFDIEFPEPARALALAGAELLLSIAANMHPYFADHELAARARALDNRLPHAYVNAIGAAGGLRFVGGSRIIDRCGRSMCEAADDDGMLLGRVIVGEPLPPEVDYLEQVRHGTSVQIVRSAVSLPVPCSPANALDPG